jgi:hypothetical protein
MHYITPICYFRVLGKKDITKLSISCYWYIHNVIDAKCLVLTVCVFVLQRQIEGLKQRMSAPDLFSACLFQCMK